MGEAGRQRGRGTPRKGRRRRGVAQARAPAEERLSDFLAAGGLLEAPVSTKEELLFSLCRIVAGASRPELVERVHKAVLAREASVNTYLGEGVAIPHYRLPNIEKPDPPTTIGVLGQTSLMVRRTARKGFR